MNELRQTIKGYKSLFLSIFNKNYIKNKIKKRSGKCKRCGKCCGDCIYLNKKTRLCKIYKKRNSLICFKNFPLDEEDQRVWGVEKVCGYKFKK